MKLTTQKVLIITLFSAFIINSKSQVSWSTSSGNAWATNSNWTGGSTPGTNGNHPTSSNAIAQFGAKKIRDSRKIKFQKNKKQHTIISSK
jgi:hypothetical protein